MFENIKDPLYAGSNKDCSVMFDVATQINNETSVKFEFHIFSI